MRPETIALKRATAETIKGVGGLEAAAGFCRIGKSVLGDNQSINRPDSFMAIDVVADLEPLARERDGWPHITRALCAQMGGAFVALPDAAARPGDLLGLLSEQARESSDLTSVICTGIVDGRLDRAECDAAIGECDQLIGAVAAMRATLIAIRERGQ
jgi:hypothetical protein